jgi:hypothetical protein
MRANKNKSEVLFLIRAVTGPAPSRKRRSNSCNTERVMWGKYKTNKRGVESKFLSELQSLNLKIWRGGPVSPTKIPLITAPWRSFPALPGPEHAGIHADQLFSGVQADELG